MTENLAAGLGEGVKGLVVKRRKVSKIPAKNDETVAARASLGICANELETALEAAARLPAPDVHWAIKADCARCRESYPQRHDKPDYIPNFGNVEAGDWTHPCTAEHDWRYCQAAKIHEALFAAALATASPQASVAENVLQRIWDERDRTDDAAVAPWILVLVKKSLGKEDY